jgi:hypothetical protein
MSVHAVSAREPIEATVKEPEIFGVPHSGAVAPAFIDKTCPAVPFGNRALVVAPV